MMALSLEQLRELAIAHGFPDADTAAAVAMAESGGDPNAHGDKTLGNSLGLWQVNLRAHPEYQGDDPTGDLGTNALFDPDANADAALAISSHGTNWRPWSTFNSGAYRKWMPTANVAGSADTALDFFILGLIALGVAYAKRRKLSVPNL